ncbi:hypothetical protein Scep_008014 [Stephania cephalantha]|uniref:Uncharacterized protein n=1 Tax=Stephania cephalantha TaxID=152367 RepID=A0AAP0PMB1_9MAGN
MTETVARSDGSGEDVGAAKLRLAKRRLVATGVRTAAPARWRDDSAMRVAQWRGFGEPPKTTELWATRRTSNADGGSRCGGTAIEGIDARRSRTSSSGGGERHELLRVWWTAAAPAPSSRAAKAMTPVRRSGGSIARGAVNEVEQRRGAGGSIPDETQQQWTARHDFDEALLHDGLLAK